MPCVALLDEQYRTTELLEAEPRCGDFCDACGDCLGCYWDDPCGQCDGGHTWFVYADEAAKFREEHPEAQIVA